MGLRGLHVAFDCLPVVGASVGTERLVLVVDNDSKAALGAIGIERSSQRRSTWLLAVGL